MTNEGNRNRSRVEFDNAYFAIDDDIERLISTNFGVSGEELERNRGYLKRKADALSELSQALYMHLKIANGIYPSSRTELEERRTHQKYAAGACNCYRSWRQTAVKDSNACYDSIQSIDKLFRELYPNCQTKDKKTRTDIVNQIFTEVDPEDIEAMWELTKRQEHGGRAHFGINVVGVGEVDAADFG